RARRAPLGPPHDQCLPHAPHAPAALENGDRMDAPDGHPAADLTRPPVEALAELRLGFVPLVRLLERLSSDAVRVGGEGPPDAEGIRFRHDRGLSFHASDVVDLGALENGDGGTGPQCQYQVTSSFLGLSGSMSPLPAYFTEELLFED